MILDELRAPVVQAPMAGGPSTPALALAVDRAGGLGFLAAGYLNLERLAADLEAARGASRLGVNVFVGAAGPADRAAVEAYAAQLAEEAKQLGATLGRPRHDDDLYEEKVSLLIEQPVAAVSFTFGLPRENDVSDLHRVGSEVWITVTSVAEAREAAALGADVLIVQGVEAGGHRGVFTDDDQQSELTTLAALQLIGADVPLPLVAAGSIMTGRGLAAVLAAGASAGQLGSALLLADEAATSPVQRTATVTATPTALTRAFSGRTARGIVNGMMREHDAEAPWGYPEVHHLTSPLRARARELGDADHVNLWAGQAHELAVSANAEAIVTRIVDDARTQLEAAQARLTSRSSRPARPGS